MSHEIKRSLSAISLALACLPLPAFAAGLGAITLRSHLGQPLRAEIDLVAVDPAEREQLQVRLASIEAHQRAHVEFAPALQSLRVSLARRAGGQVFIRISSNVPINEPFVRFLVELGTEAGRVTREYTVLLDPPGIGRGHAGVDLPVAEGAVESTPRAARTEHGPAPRSADASPSAGVYVVQVGDSLSKIALERQYEGVNLQRMMTALHRANEGAFIDGNIDRLIAGRALRIPTLEEVHAGVDADRQPGDPRGADSAGRRASGDHARSALVPPRRLPAADDSRAAPDTEIRSSRLERLEPPLKPAPVVRDRLTLAPPPAVPDPAAEAAERLVQRSRARVFELENRMDELLSTLKLANDRIVQLNRELDTMAARRGATAAESPRAASDATPAAGAPTSARSSVSTTAAHAAHAAPVGPITPAPPSTPAASSGGVGAGALGLALEVVPPGLVLTNPLPEEANPALLSFADRARGRLVPIIGSLVVMLGLLLIVLRRWLRSRVEAADDGAVYSGDAVEEMLASQKQEDHWQPLAPDAAEAMVTTEVDLNIGESAQVARAADAPVSVADSGASKEAVTDDHDAASRLSPLGSWSARLLSARRGAASTRSRGRT